MAKLSCTREEFEQFKSIHDHFSFFYDPKRDIPDSEYSLRKADLIDEVKEFWPIFQRLCEKFGILLEIEHRPLFYSPAAKINYARAFCDRTDFVEDKPIPKKLIDLDILVRVIKSCTKSGKPEVNMWEISNNLAAKVSKEEAWKCNRLIMRQIKKIFDELLIHLRKCFGEEIETQISVPKPAETEQNTKTTIIAIIISLFIICIFVLSVRFISLTPLTWLKNHPNSYALQSSISCLIACFIFRLCKPKWRKLCWACALMALAVLLSQLGGPAENNVN